MSNALAEAVQKKINNVQTWLYGDTLAPPEDALGEHDNLLAYVQAIEAENEELRGRLADVETQLDGIQDLGREKSTKEEKVAALVQYAQNVATNPKSERVVIKATTIKGVVGCSRRYAYDLMDDLPGEHDWALDRGDISQYGDLELDKDAQDRALVIDLEVLHTDDAAVNKFTTRTDEEAVSA